MNKKVMAIAVAGAFAAAPALTQAQTSTVQIGGSLTSFYYQHSPKNASVGQKTDILETSEPEMFIRAEENLGGGLSVWFQCTSSLDGYVTGGDNGAGGNTAFGLCGRNSGLGFKGNWGTFFGGNWDTPHKLVYNQARQWFGGTNSFTGGSARILLGSSASGQANSQSMTVAGVTVTSNTPASFFRRQAQQLAYWSPSWNGFTVNAAYSASNEQTGIAEANTLSPRMYSLAANYTNGPLYLGVAYEQHKDYNPSGVVPAGTVGSTYNGGNDDNWLLVAGYRWGAFNARLAYTKTEYEVTNTTSTDVDGWAFFADWNIQGPHTLRFQYADVSSTGGTATRSVGAYKGALSAGCGPTSTTACAAGNGAKVWSIFYSYAFSKRTEGSIGYTKLDNDSVGTHSLGKVASSAGSSQTSMGLVLKHRF